MRRRRHAIAVLLALLTMVLPAASAASEAAIPIRIQLKWHHQFQFAGFYAALEQGYFREAGLDVTLLEGGPEIIPTLRVTSGEADFGIGTSGLLVTRSRNRPIVAVAAIFQHSPYLLLTRSDPEFSDLASLRGRQVMVEPYAEELLAWLRVAGVDPDEIIQVGHTGDPTDVLQGDIVGMTAYLTTEPIQLNARGLPYRIFEPKLDGIDFYGDTLFTSEAFARAHPDVVVAVRDALVRGWLYAFSNTAEIAGLIDEQYGSPLTLEELKQEAAEIRRLLVPDLIEIGYMNPRRWAHIHDIFEQAGLIEHPVDLEAFLFSPPVERDWALFLRVLAALLLLLGVGGLYSLRILRLNRRLLKEIEARKRAEEELRRMARVDPGTGLLNRRGFHQGAEAAMRLSAREGLPVSLVVVDIDHFKDINDRFGHNEGDIALRHFAEVCVAAMRSSDIVGRFGGEEFVILLPGSDKTTALRAAERLRKSLREHPATLAGTEVTLNVSMGIADTSACTSLDDLLREADANLYIAKRTGRDRIIGDSNESNAPSDEDHADR